MQPSTLVFICLCGSRALRPPPPVVDQRRRCSHSATPRGFGSTPTKTKKKKAKREGLFRVELRHADGIGTALGASAAAVGWDENAPAATRTDVEGVAGAFLIHNALTPKECDRLAALANEAGFEEAPKDERRDQQSHIYRAPQAAPSDAAERVGASSAAECQAHRSQRCEAPQKLPAQRSDAIVRIVRTAVERLSLIHI